MAHPLVGQLRFARSALMRGVQGVSDEDARRRLLPMNCISWIVGHLARQENRYWVLMGQGKTLLPELDDLVGSGRPASTPPLDEMLEAWRTVTAAADPFLDSLTTETLQSRLEWKGKAVAESIGTQLLRTTYHYWYHIGESQAVRQLLKHTDLPTYVGAIGEEAPYRPE